MTLRVPISWGELLDKISILEIKQEKITDQKKLENINHELVLLCRVRDEKITSSQDVKTLCGDLKKVNEQLWDIEDKIRICEGYKDFGKNFIELARSVYITNDKRAAFKYELNKVLGSEVVEEKSYQDY